MNSIKFLLPTLILGVFACAPSQVTAQQWRGRDGSGFGIWREAGGGYLGIHLRDVRSNDVSNLKLPSEDGVVVEKVLSGSPAAEAGLQQNDVIVEFNNERIHSAVQLRRLVWETLPGRSVLLAAIREGRRKSFNVKMVEGPRQFLPGIPEGAFEFELPFGLGWMRRFTPPASQSVRLGVQVQDLTEQLAEYFRVPGKSGVLVTSVNEGSPAKKAGLRAGDVITAANSKAVTRTQDLSGILREERLRTLKLECIRGGQRLTIDVAVEPVQKKTWEGGFQL
ncbi:MAG: PDZ domain-containing protein [Acidobacteria bacterium]|nr:PDZ domain-containing protein [Acidobacteriota bacterium]